MHTTGVTIQLTTETLSTQRALYFHQAPGIWHKQGIKILFIVILKNIL